jgi:hypothetical protein
MQPLATFDADEFGNPREASGRRYGWLGGKQRRTQFASGVVQMGVRSYVTAMGGSRAWIRWQAAPPTLTITRRRSVEQVRSLREVLLPLDGG